MVDDDEMVVSSFVFRLPDPFIVDDVEVIKDGYHGILFDFFDRWYNVVTIYDGEKKFVGYYSDIRTPPERIPGGYRATDLALDLWVTPDGMYTVLDRDEFDAASFEKNHRKKAEETLSKLIEMVIDGRYPPKVVWDFCIR